jgi:hypothetical protein
MPQPETPASRPDTTTVSPDQSNELSVANKEIQFAYEPTLFSYAPTKSELIEKQSEKSRIVRDLVRPFLQSPKLVTGHLSELLIDVNLAGTNQGKLSCCLGRIEDLKTIAEALKVHFPNIPIDEKQINWLHETIVELTQGDLSDYEKGDPKWEEEIEASLSAIQRSIPLLHIWADVAEREADPWSRPMSKQDWTQANKLVLTTGMWRRITKIKDGRVQGGSSGRGPWKLRRSVCEEFGLQFPSNGS